MNNHNEILTYDNEPEECMYRLPGETEEDFEKRLDKLRKIRHATMTEEDKEIVEKLEKGIAPPIIEDDDN